MTASARRLGAILGAEVVTTRPLRWGFTHHTDLVSLADGRQVVVKRFEGPAGGAELRRAVALSRRLDAAGIPTPAVLVVDHDIDPPILVLAHVEGTTGAEWLDDDVRARRLAGTMGELAVRFRDLPIEPADSSDPGAWSDPERLGHAAAAWLRSLGPDLTLDARERIAHTIDALTESCGTTPPRLSHGDFVPVNALLAPDGRLAGVLDLGAWRVAHPWLDVAWWGWVVRSFHPDAWAASWTTMLAAAGIPDDDRSAVTLQGLAVVRCLEWAATRHDPAAPSLLAASAAWRIRG